MLVALGSETVNRGVAVFVFQTAADTLYENVRVVEDGATSDEEVGSTSYLQQSQAFPPLVKITGQDH